MYSIQTKMEMNHSDFEEDDDDFVCESARSTLQNENHLDNLSIPFP